MHSERGTLKVVSDAGARIYVQSAHEQCAVCYRVKQQENLFLVSLQAFFLLHACILTSKASSWHERVAGRDRRSQKSLIQIKTCIEQYIHKKLLVHRTPVNEHAKWIFETERGCIACIYKWNDGQSWLTWIHKHI